MASASPYLLELFTADHDQKRIENIITYKLNGGYDPNALEILVDYAYTAQLNVRFSEVSFLPSEPSVFKYAVLNITT